MRQSADAMRAAAAKPDASASAKEQSIKAMEAQLDVARELDALAEKLVAPALAGDEETRRLSEQRARAQELRQELDRLARELEAAGEPGRSGQDGPRGARAAGGRGGSGGSGTDLARLRDEYVKTLRESRELLERIRQDDPTFSTGGPGVTFEDQGMTLSAPGTEAFKQDFARWEQLRQQTTQLLVRAESQLSQRMQTKGASDRLAAGADDTPPPRYQEQVDQYFRRLAGKR
jgi:hypothetical protein